MSKLQFLLLTGILSLLTAGCRIGGDSPVYDVVVVGGGPAGIGAALAAAETGLFSISLNVLEPSRLGLCSQKVSAICWSPAAPSQVTTVLIQPSVSKPLVWVWGRPLASQPPSPPHSAAILGTFP